MVRLSPFQQFRCLLKQQRREDGLRGHRLQINVIHGRKGSKGPDTAAIPQCQFLHFADLALLLAHGLGRDPERLGVRPLVDIVPFADRRVLGIASQGDRRTAQRRVRDRPSRTPTPVHPLARIKLTKRVQLGGFTGQPRQHAAFNVGQIGHDQLFIFWRNQTTAQRAAGQRHDIVKDQIHTTGFHGINANRDHFLAERGARQVVRLEQPPCPAPGATGPIELQRAAQAAIAAGAVQ
ncbi:hypothetical protein ACN3VN_04240 [Xylella fastidiosa]|uniref:hypothetical protein n=1 Tax=Xylella fastidiosa TaxID=2371 RepID=UPI003AFAB80B